MNLLGFLINVLVLLVLLVTVLFLGR